VHSDDSVTALIERLHSGDRAAAQHLWERYFPRLVGLARQRLKGVARRVSDEEDVALAAFDSFCRRAEKGDAPRLDDRDSLWGLLATITARKAAFAPYQPHHSASDRFHRFSVGCRMQCFDDTPIRVKYAPRGPEQNVAWDSVCSHRDAKPGTQPRRRRS
jgi:hypothetical protein